MLHDVSRHTRSLQTNVAYAELEVPHRFRNSRPDDVIDHSSRRQSRVRNAGHSTWRHLKCSDVESDVCTDSFDDEDDVVNSRLNALDVKQTPCLEGRRSSPLYSYSITVS